MGESSKCMFAGNLSKYYTQYKRTNCFGDVIEISDYTTNSDRYNKVCYYHNPCVLCCVRVTDMSKPGIHGYLVSFENNTYGVMCERCATKKNVTDCTPQKFICYTPPFNNSSKKNHSALEKTAHTLHMSHMSHQAGTQLASFLGQPPPPSCIIS